MKRKKKQLKLSPLLLCAGSLTFGFVLGVLVGQQIGIRKVQKTIEQDFSQQQIQHKQTMQKEGYDYRQLQQYIHTLHFLTPVDREKLCLGQYYPITWQLPADGVSESTLKIDGHVLGKFPNGYGGDEKGTTTYLWKTGYNRDNIQLVPGKTYTLLVSATYSNTRVPFDFTYFSNPFTVVTCR